MSLMDVVAVLQRMGEEIRATTADAETATKAVRELKKTSASMSKGTTGGSMGASSSSSSAEPSSGKGSGITAGALVAALQSVKGRTGA